MAPSLGTILNMSTELKRVTSIIKAGNTVVPGLVYIDDTNGVKNAPTDGSKTASELYWYDKSVVLAATDADKEVVVFAIDGLQVVGKADGVINVNTKSRASETAAHGGQLQTQTIRTDTLPNNNTDKDKVAGIYRGHVDEIKEIPHPTNAADEDEDCVFDMVVGGLLD